MLIAEIIDKVSKIARKSTGVIIRSRTYSDSLK